MISVHPQAVNSKNRWDIYISRLVNGGLWPVGQLVKMHVIQGIILVVVVIEDGGIVVDHRVMAARSPGRRRRHRRELVVGGSGG